MLPIKLLITFITTISLCLSSPVYNMQPAQITANVGSMGRNIRNLPCVSLRTGTQGTCMFAIDCLKANGTHLGTCIDRFYFGSCCHLVQKEVPALDTLSGILDNSIDQEHDTYIKPPKIPPDTSNLPTLLATQTTTTESNNIPPIEDFTPTLKPTTTSSTTTTTEKFVTTQYIETTTPTTLKPTVVTTTQKTTTKRTAPTTKKTVTTTPVVTKKPPPKVTTNQSIENEVVKKPTNKTTVPTTTQQPIKVTTFQTIHNKTTVPIVATITRKPVRVTTTTTTTTKKPVKATVKPTTTKKPVKVATTTSKPTTTKLTNTKPTLPVLIPVETVKPKVNSTTESPLENEITPVDEVGTTQYPGLVTWTSVNDGNKGGQDIITQSTSTSTQKPTTTTQRTTTTTQRITTTTQRVTTAKPSTTTKSQRPTTTTQRPTKTTQRTTTVKPTTRAPTTVTKAPTTVTKSPPTTVSTTKVPTTKPPTTESITVTTPMSTRLTTTMSVESAPTTVETISSALNNGTVIDPDEWTPITPPDGWVLLPSVSTASNISTPESTTPSTINMTTVSDIPSIVSFPEDASPPPMVFPDGTTEESVLLPSSNFTTWEDIQKNISMTTPAGGVLSTSTTSEDEFTIRPQLNMSDYLQVCGRRMYPQARIVGGENSTFGRWPWQISLRQWRTSTYLHKCGAALLNENWAITAAHCVDSVPPSDLLLRLGEHDLSSESEPYGFQERRVQIVASHPQFDPRTFEYDLALLRFYEPVVFQPNIIPVCVPTNDEGYVGKTAHVTGWGRLYEDGPLPNVLQEVSVPVINNTLCEQMYRSAGYIEHIPNIFICAGWKRGGFDSCEGDSGGPMVLQRPEDKRFILAGVISWGIGCAEPNQPGVYTRISEFRHWINQILQF